VARTNDFPRVLWLVTSAWIAGCGRVGFGALHDDPGGPLSDAPTGIPDTAAPIVDAAPLIDAPPMVDAAPIVDTAPITDTIAAGTPDIAFAIPPMTSTCGAGATTVTATVSNPGTADLVINKITLSKGALSAFRVVGTFPMTIAPTKAADFQITALAAVLGSDRGGDLKSDDLVIEANLTTNKVPISKTIMGANIDVTLPAPPPPPELFFSDSSGLCPAAQQAKVTNTGNLPVTVNVQVSGPFTMAGTSSASVAIGATLVRNFQPFASGACSGAGVITYQVIAGNSCSSTAVVATIDATLSITGTSSACFCP
jgi:hypothetical protein